MENNVNDSTPVVVLTVGQLREILREEHHPVEEKDNIMSKHLEKYVYGLRGIRNLFGVSHSTAQKYKDTILRPAVRQCGRKIIVDAQLAVELFNAANKNKPTVAL